MDGDLGAPTDPTSRRLDIACSLVDVLLARSAVDRDGLALLDELALPTGVFTTSAVPPLVNAAWQRLFGTVSPEPLIARIAEAAHTGETLHMPSLALDDRLAYYAVTLRPVRDVVIVVCVGITDEVVARALATPPGALVWSGPSGGTADYGNAAWSVYTGASAAMWRERIRTRDLGPCAGPVPGSAFDAWIRRADGVDRWHHVSFTMSDRRWFATAIDIDELRLEEEGRDMVAHERSLRIEAEQAGRRKDQFLAAVSHELRSPLTTMLLWERVLQDEASDTTMRVQALEAIHQSAMSQSRLIGDLLDVARAISGKLHFDLRIVDVEHVLGDALAAIEPSAASKQITLERRGAASLAAVQGDDARLRQVFDNLLSNAVKFTHRGGRITIGVTQTSTSIEIEFADNGRGIAREFLPHLFEPFSQTDDSLTRRAGGLGLGLTIANQLVALHRGTLTATSNGRDLGAAFTVTLPIAIGRQVLPLPSVARRRTLDHVRVLVVDDDRRVRDALALLLDRAGAVVDTAESAEVARQRIASRPPQAVVCDIAMPGEDGYSFIRQLRASGREVPAIALTAHATESDARNALAAGFDVHLAKPIDFECLVENIDELITSRAASTGST